MTTETTTFGHLTITFDETVLRPRQWTIRQAEWAAALLDDAPEGPVLELCTGVGHIGLLAVEASGRELVLVDREGVACAYARVNAAAAGTPRVDVRHGRMDEVLSPAERFAVIIADPPWVPTADIAKFPDDPMSAINGGADGLELTVTCLEIIDHHLLDLGAAVLQVGTEEQVSAVERHVAEHGLRLKVVESRAHEDRGVLVHLARA